MSRFVAFMRTLFCVKLVKKEISMISHLPIIKRVCHPHSRKPMAALGVSAMIMVAASTLSVEASHLSHWLSLPHNIIDAFAYLCHGIGAVPICKYAEPLWMIVMGEK
jgi:hypothetical protein